jgi:hypothetical protein
MPKQIEQTNFPETIFAKEENDEGNRFLVVSADPSDLLAERGVAVPAAEYKLVRAGVVIESTVTVR